MVKVKICGLKTEEAVEAAIEAGADFIGLVHFAKSPRHVSLEQAAKLAQQARGRTKTVLLLVNPDDALLALVARQVDTDYVQLHGSETPERVAQVKQRLSRPVIKAVAVADSDDLAASKRYDEVAEILLIDAKPPAGSVLPGGNGIPIDLALLEEFNSHNAIQSPQTFMLAGGLDPETIYDLVRLYKPPMVDVSSGVEQAPGVKDPDKVRRFVAQARAGAEQAASSG